MGMSSAIIKLALKSSFFFNVLTKLMAKIITEKTIKEEEKMVDIQPILKKHNLKLVETGFFREKKTISRVKDIDGQNFILKTGRIEPFQIMLLQTAKKMENKLCFKTPSIIKQGKEWILLEEIKGKLLNFCYNTDPDLAVEISKKISDDYQKIIAELLKKEVPGDLLEDGKKWLFSKICLWGGPIIEEGLIDFQLIKELAERFEDIVNKKGVDFFDWFHGNIIGDHVIIRDSKVYLLDLHVVPRAGKGYYDFLRALDFLFLKTSNSKKIFKNIPKWMSQHLAREDMDEVKTVFASRCIGVLGWDIIYNKDRGVGNLEEKKKLLVNFIKAEY